MPDKPTSREDLDTPIRLDASESIEQYKETIAAQHARTRNLVTLILIWAVVLSLPMYLAVYIALVAWKGPDAVAKVEPVFERWFALIGPLAGTAVGAYYVSSHSRRRRPERE
jgi:hypothetical protein